MGKLNDIKIIGGGSAGWMTATTLIRKLPKGHKITLIESPNIATVGVGESTIGGISNWLASVKLHSKLNEFVKLTDGTIKLSIRFEDFYKKGDGGFHYPFGLPVTLGNSFGTNDWYVKKMKYPETHPSDFATQMYGQMAMVNANTLTNKETNIPFNWAGDKALHFDATKFGLYLKDTVCIPEGVQHVKANVQDVITKDGAVDKVILDNGEEVTADLFIDCTGFKSLLLGKALNEEFVDYSPILPNNSAWATRLPYKNRKKEMNLYTDCLAMNNGWVWKIPLWTRWGSGYVYSNKYISDEDALQEFKDFIKKKDYTSANVDELEFKNIKMRVGRHKRLWVKNVCAIGLAGGFIEPLESNGLYSVHEFLNELVKAIGGDRAGHYTAYDRNEFNNSVTSKFDGFAAFVAMHYSLSHRDDTEYWRDVNERDYVELWEKMGHSKHNPFEDSFRRKNLEGSWGLYEGLNCIAPGMRWNILSEGLVSLTDAVENPVQNYNTFWEESIRKLNARSKSWSEIAKRLPSTYEFIRDEFFDGKDEITPE
jgi:tryptophan halogenase